MYSTDFKKPKPPSGAKTRLPPIPEDKVVEGKAVTGIPQPRNLPPTSLRTNETQHKQSVKPSIKYIASSAALGFAFGSICLGQVSEPSDREVLFILLAGAALGAIAGTVLTVYKVRKESNETSQGNILREIEIR